MDVIDKSRQNIMDSMMDRITGLRAALANNPLPTDDADEMEVHDDDVTKPEPAKLEPAKPKEKQEKNSKGTKEGDSKKEDGNTLFRYLFIDSANRDREIWPLSGEFEVVIPEGIYNLSECVMIQAKFPVTDPAVHGGNSSLRFGIGAAFPPAAVYTARVPSGSYKGTELALEVTTQMNLAIFGADIAATTHVMDYATGLVSIVAPPGLATGNARCTFIEPRASFTFAILDSSALPANANALYLYIKLALQRSPYFTQIDDLYENLGYDRQIAFQVGDYDSTSQCAVINTGTAYAPASGFGGGPNAVDIRFNYVLHSNIAALFQSTDTALISIDTLNDSDIVNVEPGHLQRVYTGPILGRVFLKDTVGTNDKFVEINNMGYPIQKKYVLPRSLNRCLVRVMRPDGSINNFGGRDFTMTLGLKIIKAQQTGNVRLITHR